MLILAVETATFQPSVAVIEERKILGSVVLRSDKSLTSQLLPEIDRLLGSLHLDVSALQGLAVSIGPGSFTGLRVGLATMSAMRLALNIPLVGVSTLEGLAWNVPPSPLPILSTVFIKPGSLYFGKFAWQGGQIGRLGEEQMGTVSEALQELTGQTLVVGDGWSRNQDQFSQGDGKLVVPRVDSPALSAFGIGLAGQVLFAQGAVLPEGINPHYIQLSYAETQPSLKPEERR